MDLGVNDVATQPIGVGLSSLQSATTTDLILRALAGKVGNAVSMFTIAMPFVSFLPPHFFLMTAGLLCKPLYARSSAYPRLC